MRSKLFAMSKVVKSCCNIDFAVLLKSGTKVALNYAIKKGTCIKNVFTQLQSKM